MKNEQVMFKFSKNLSKINKILPGAIEPVEKVVIKKFASRPRPQPHRCSSPILPRNQNHGGNRLGITETSTNIVDVKNLKVKTPSWVKKAPTFRRDAWEETDKVSSIHDVTVKIPSALITSKGSKTAGSKPSSVKNYTENNITRYRRHVSKYSFKSSFPIHKLALKSSSENLMNSQSCLRPILVCDCPLNAQVSPDSQCLPRVIVKDSANFAKFRRDIGGSESPVNSGSFSTAFPEKECHARGPHGPAAIKAQSRGKSRNSQSSCRQNGVTGKLVASSNSSRQRKSGNYLFSLAIPEDEECQIKMSEHSFQQCSLNDGYIVKRIIYTVENDLGNSLSKSRPRKSRISPGIGG